MSTTAPGTVSSSQDAPVCAVQGCTSHAVPGSDRCGDEDHNSISPEQTDGTIAPQSDQLAGYSDGTGRSKKYKPRRSQKARQDLRVVGDKPGTVTVEGYALKYEQPYEVNDMFGTFIEVMKRGAAANVTGDDCRLLFNHQGMPMARTTNGTLMLDDDGVGLHIRADLDVANSTLASDVAAVIERGDVTQMSVGFVVAKGGDAWNDDFTYRRITRLGELMDCSPVTYPASPTTSIQIAREAVTPHAVRAQFIQQRREAQRQRLLRQLSPAGRTEMERSAR